MPVRMNGATSGYVELSAPAIAGTTSLVLPKDSVQPGLVLVATGSVTAGSAININNCFTATYDNYRIMVRTNAGTTARFRAGGVDASAANYSRQYTSAVSTTLAGARATTDTSMNLENSATDHVAVVDIFGPFAAAPTYWVSHVPTGGSSPNLYIEHGYHSLSTSYDGLSILGSSMTATVRVYGYRNSITT